MPVIRDPIERIADDIATVLGDKDAFKRMRRRRLAARLNESHRENKRRKLKQAIERGSTQQAAAILGLGHRKVQAMSQRGEIPGAAKMGRQWTYDLAKLRRFVAQQEQACHASGKHWPDATGGGIPFGARLWSAGNSSDGRLKQMIQRSQKRVAKLVRSAQ